MGWIDFQDKKVFLIIDTTVGERRYTGTIKEVTYTGKTVDGVESYLLLLDDKMVNKLIGFSSNQIKLIQEEK